MTTESKKLKTNFDKETNAAIGAFGKYIHAAAPYLQD